MSQDSNKSAEQTSSGERRAFPARTVIGRVRSHRGSKGAVTLQIHPQDAELWTGLARVWVPKPFDAWVAAEECRPYKDKLILKLEGFNSIDQAGKLKGLRLEAARDDLPRIQEDEFWIEDLVGCTLFVEQIRSEVSADSDGSGVGSLRPVGVVQGLLETGGTDLLRVESNSTPVRELLIPLNKELLYSVDPAARRIHARLPEGLLELNSEADNAASQRDPSDAESSDASDASNSHAKEEVARGSVFPEKVSQGSDACGGRADSSLGGKSVDPEGS